MDSRVVLDALTPSVTEFAREAYRPTTNAQVTLRQSLKQHFVQGVSVAAPCEDVVSSRLLSVSSLAELQRAILHARTNGLKVRASTGGLASGSNREMLEDGGVVLDVSGLTNMVYHKARGVIVAQCGVSIRDLNNAADGWNVSQRVHIAPSRTARSVGAAFVMGVYGYGGSEGVLGDAVVEVSIVDSRGRLRVYSNRDKVWGAVKVNLGMWGVVYDVTIRVDDFRRVAHVKDEFVSIGMMLKGGVLERMEKKGVVHMIWTPFNSYRGSKWEGKEDAVWVRSMKRCNGEVDEEENVMFRWLTIVQWMGLRGMELAKEGYGWYEGRDVMLFHALGLQQTAWKFLNGGGRLKVSHAVGFQNDAENWPVWEVGCAFGGWASVRKGWEIVVGEVEKWEEDGQFPLNVGVRMNLVKESDAWIGGQGKAVLSLVSAKYTKGWRRFAHEVVQKWAKVGGRVRIGRELGKIWEGGVGGGERWRRAWSEEGVDDCGMFAHGVYSDMLQLQSVEKEEHKLRWAKSLDELGKHWDEAPVVKRKLSYQEKVSVEVFSDDESVDSELGIRRTYSRRKKVVLGYQPVLSKPECSLLVAYVVVYFVLWLGLFGKSAARQLGWIA